MSLACTFPQVRRGTREVLDAQELTFEPGVSTLVGLNGAGKSTLFLSILGLLPAVNCARSRVIASGLQISSADRPAWMAAVGYQPQEVPAPRGIKLVEFVAYAGWLKGLEESAARSAAAPVLEQVGLGEHLIRPLAELSGGMRRRAGLAAAIVHAPKVLLLDEPTAGLDPVERVRFHELVREHCRDMTVVVSTHIADDVEALGGQVVGLAQRRLTSLGAAHEMTDVRTEVVAWLEGRGR